MFALFQPNRSQLSQIMKGAWAIVKSDKNKVTQIGEAMRIMWFRWRWSQLMTLEVITNFVFYRVSDGQPTFRKASNIRFRANLSNPYLIRFFDAQIKKVRSFRIDHFSHLQFSDYELIWERSKESTVTYVKLDCNDLPYVTADPLFATLRKTA